MALLRKEMRLNVTLYYYETLDEARAHDEGSRYRTVITHEKYGPYVVHEHYYQKKQG